MNPVKSPPDNLVIYETAGTWDERIDPRLGPHFLGLWVEGGYTFFFFDREAERPMRRLIEKRTDLKLRWTHRMKYAEWQDGTDFAPIRVGGLTIIPAWTGPPKKAGPGLIRMNPGLAFGFGGHPTTRACLECLVRVYREDHPLQVLDLGTGTGVLALAAARLGAARVTAVEYSRTAAETARANAVLNALEGTVEVVEGRAEDFFDLPADLVCANLHFSVQEEIFQRGGFKNRRWLIQSGMFQGQAAEMGERLKDQDFRLVDLIRDERWATMLWRARSSL